MAEKRELCLFLNKECCFYVNQSGAVREGEKKLADQVSQIHQWLSKSWEVWPHFWNWASWLLPFTGPLLMLFLALLFGLCLFNLLTKFVSSHLESIKFQMVVQMEPLMLVPHKFYQPLDRPLRE